jgi:hypothetical protein
MDVSCPTDVLSSGGSYTSHCHVTQCQVRAKYEFSPRLPFRAILDETRDISFGCPDACIIFTVLKYIALRNRHQLSHGKVMELLLYEDSPVM